MVVVRVMLQTALSFPYIALAVLFPAKVIIITIQGDYCYFQRIVLFTAGDVTII